MAITDILKTGRIPYTYKVGEKSTGKPMPFDVKLSIDTNFQNAVTKWVTIGSAAVGAGIVIGFLLTKPKTRRK